MIQESQNPAETKAVPAKEKKTRGPLDPASPAGVRNRWSKAKREHAASEAAVAKSRDALTAAEAELAAKAAALRAVEAEVLALIAPPEPPK